MSFIYIEPIPDQQGFSECNVRATDCCTYFAAQPGLQATSGVLRELLQ